MLDAEITPDEFDSSIKNLKKEKSAGPDTVLNEFIINAPNAVKVVLLQLFNRILSMEYFPALWARGSITPVFKSGDINDVNNYRGITVLSCLGKLFTRIINDRLVKWVEKYNILNETQFVLEKEGGQLTVYIYYMD